MTRDEALEKLEEMADESKALEHIDEFCGLEQAIKAVKQIDEPKWHTVAEEGYPKEDGWYNICENYSMTDKKPTYFVSWFEDGDFENNDGCIIAWQKIEEYKE